MNKIKYLSIIFVMVSYIVINSVDGKAIEQNEFIIKTSYIKDLTESYSINIVDTIEGENIYKISIVDDIHKSINGLMENPRVESYSTNVELELPIESKLLFSSAFALPNNWGYKSMNFPIHNVINNDSDVEIAILDTGVDINHPVLKSSIEKGFDAFGYENINDENGHGTHIAGVIVRDTSQTKIIPIKVLDHNGKGDLFTILQGLQYAIDQKIEIINMSLGISKDIPLLKEKIDEAIDKGSIIISSSGNEGKSSLQYPANYPNVISVGAYDINEAIASFSQYGENLDFVAPGVDIWSTWNDGELKMHSGTSIAAAFVTKAVGLIKSSKPNIKNEDIVDVLINSAKPLAQETEKQKMGYGKIDVSKALDISSGEIKYFKSKHDVPTNKIWSVTMSGAIDAKLFNKQLIKVIDEQGKIMQIEPVIDKTNPSIIKIMPPITGYEIGQSYQLIIEKGIVSKDDKNLQKEVRMQFTIEE